MSKSTSLPYREPFRYTRPAKDLQAMFGAQTGNPPIIPAERSKAGKPSSAGKKRPSAAAGKSSKPSKPKAAKPKAAKPAATKAAPSKSKASKAKAKPKKPSGRR